MSTHGTTASADGTTLAWTRQGSGPDLVMVHCVAVDRTTTPQPTLPAALAEHFTVWTYDRRGTGESGGGETDYSLERELQDLSAVLALTSGPVTLYGFSSGATLSLLAAEAGLPVDRLALLEPPLFDQADPDHGLRGEFERRLAVGPKEGRDWFTTQVVGVPEEVLAQMPPASEQDLRNAPAIAHELTFLPGTPASRFSGVQQPTLVIASASTAPQILAYAEQLEQSLPHATRAVVEGEWHGVDDATLTDLITTFATRED